MAKLSDLLGGGAGAVPIWASGMTVQQGVVVLSPAANLRPYIRTAATGGGTTDPALDSSTYRAFCERPARAIYGADSTASADMPTMGTSAWRNANNLRKVLAGALTANTYKSILSISGAGRLRFACAAVADSTSRTASVRIVSDGVVVLERSVAFTGYSDVGILAVGGMDQTSVNLTARFGDLAFNASLSIDVRSSLAETDKLYLITNYEAQ
jgi:hypothetical protein